MVGANPTMIERAREGIREFFLLQHAEKQSEVRSASQRDAIRLYHEAASRRITVAQDLRGPIQTPAALALYQQGSLFYALAYLLNEDESLDPRSLTPEETFRKLEGAMAADGLTPPHEFQSARPMLVASDPLELDRASPEEADRRIEELAVVAGWLSRLVDARSPREIKTARIARITVGAVSGLALIAILVTQIFAPKNLAHHRLATASSEGFSTTASGAVDGSRNVGYGFHSQLEDSPWLSIDLGRAYAIAQIEVFGRGDGHYDQSVPLFLEISDSGADYGQVASRTEPFSDSEPWVIKPAPPLVTRYLRLRTTRRSYLVLNEVEVYGKTVKR
jgi:F5/8 type C domain